ncbi:hypothetical protein FDH29_gp30 [Aquamicrobium phage P14]|uniref:Uncharacterized protein n=1 Tax=Aquamicrobium phage P14 TaxID=1927013 RepID=A0A1L5C066_9CAUD|nr:hypothetical protein FDH29_gp30 [Aquamicrobium phage P14]APL99488.1 hypothetical protein BB738_0300 [Aquamicrobium phage P14]
MSKKKNEVIDTLTEAIIDGGLRWQENLQSAIDRVFNTESDGFKADLYARIVEGVEGGFATIRSVVALEV